MLRLLLPKIDKERGSYGIQVTTMGQLYIRAFGFSPNSTEAKCLTTSKGFTAGGKAEDYAEVVYKVIKDRCSKTSTLSISDLNEYLDTIADAATKRSGN